MLQRLKENVSMAEHTTFRIGGPARYFFEAKTADEIKDAILWAKENQLPYFVLGGGSNLLVSDGGFQGLVIKVSSSRFQVLGDIINVDAGVPLIKLVVESVNSGLMGLEWAIGIPGTIGGAVCGNAGGYGHSISENIIGVKAINQGGEIIELDKNSCRFCYRGSAFKEKNNELTIIEVTLRLAKDENSQGREKIKEIITKRKNTVPAFPSSGSFFKNIKLENQSDDFKKLIPPEKTKNGMLPTAYLIESCGLKGKTIGGAQISEQHANFIVNIGKAKASDVLTLVKICKEKVKEKFNIDLEEETRFIGF